MEDRRGKLRGLIRDKRRGYWNKMMVDLSGKLTFPHPGGPSRRTP